MAEKGRGNSNGKDDKSKSKATPDYIVEIDARGHANFIISKEVKKILEVLEKKL